MRPQFWRFPFNRTTYGTVTIAGGEISVYYCSAVQLATTTRNRRPPVSNGIIPSLLRRNGSTFLGPLISRFVVSRCSGPPPEQLGVLFGARRSILAACKAQGTFYSRSLVVLFPLLTLTRSPFRDSTVP